MLHRDLQSIVNGSRGVRSNEIFDIRVIRIRSAERAGVLRIAGRQVLKQVRIGADPIVIDPEVNEVSREVPVLGQLMLHAAAHLERIGRTYVRAERLDALNAHRNLPGEELCRGVTEWIRRLKEVNGVRCGRRKRRRKSSLTIKNLTVNRLVGLDVGVIQARTTADYRFARAGRVISKSKTRLEQKVLIVVWRCGCARTG